MIFSKFERLFDVTKTFYIYLLNEFRIDSIQTNLFTSYRSSYKIKNCNITEKCRLRKGESNVKIYKWQDIFCIVLEPASLINDEAKPNIAFKKQQPTKENLTQLLIIQLLLRTNK